LPRDLRVSDAEEVLASFHPRFHSLGKHYRFLIDRAPVQGVFLASRAVHFPGGLDVRSMREAARVLVGEHDFAAFRSQDARGTAARGDGSPTDETSSAGPATRRTVYHIGVSEARSLVAIDVWGRSFLYKMVRTIAGSLLEIGRGHRNVDWLREGLLSRDRRRVGPTLAPHGLCLRAVYYDPGPLEADMLSHRSLEALDPWKLL
jgi:tRNA pseudouridine38-40 synthase